MEGIGSQVSHKIRAAIKAKLVELGAYIDDELPDYIMVMVANKRSRQQMDEDLQLFLGTHTKAFTGWLYAVLQKLQEVTVCNYDTKKEEPKDKGEKRKRPDPGESSKKFDKSTEEQIKEAKKKVKDEGESKKSKYKGKGKEKDKDKNQGGNDKEKKPGDDKGAGSSHTRPVDPHVGKSQGKVTGKGGKNQSDSSVPKVPEKVNSNSEPEVTSAKSSSPSHYSDEHVKSTLQNEPEEGDASPEEDRDEEMEDDFNIEPLEPLRKAEGQSTSGKLDDKPKTSKSESQTKPTPVTIKAPTRELLREHNKIIREREGTLVKRRKKSHDTPPCGDTRKSARKRARKNLPISQTLAKKKSHLSDVEALQTSSKGKEEATFSSHRAKRISQRRDHDVEEDEDTYNPDNSSSDPFWESAYSPNDNYDSPIPSTSEPKSNIISISKSLEMEKNLAGKSQKKSGNKTTSSPKKKPVSSRVFTIPEPEEPEIPSVIKVKPREFVPKDKQANKALILKAVADAEKSVATAQPRNDTDIEPKKSDARPGKRSDLLISESMRGKGKKYQKLAVTLSNVKADGTIADRVKSKRVVSVDPEKANTQGGKTESLKDSEHSQEFKSVPDLTLKNISNKSEDQFISSKQSAMEKNDKYIHCWLEGVEKAVKDDEIVIPSEIEDFHVTFSDAEGPMALERDCYLSTPSSGEDLTSQIMENEGSLIDEEEESEGPSGSTKEGEDGGPEIVVTLDGLTSKAIKDIILRNRDLPNGPLMGSTSKKTDLKKDLDDEEIEDEEEEMEVEVEEEEEGEEDEEVDGEEEEEEEDEEEDEEGEEEVIEEEEDEEVDEEEEEIVEEEEEEEEQEERPGFRFKKVDSSREAGTSKQSSSGNPGKSSKLGKISERFGRINKTSENHEYKDKYYKFERERYEKKYLKYQGTDKEKHYEKLKNKYASPRQSKNKKLIARLSEKFGKVDREFDDKKRKYSGDNLRYSYYKKGDRGAERDAKPSKRDRNTVRSEKPK